MKIGLIGLKKAGKTTIFNALTRCEIATEAFTTTKMEPNLAVVEVADERVTRLKEMYNPKKTTNATLELIDFVGIAQDQERKQVFSAAELGLIKNVDALALVLRNFSDEMLDQTFGESNPQTDMQTLISEIILSDLILAETRLERIDHQMKRGVKTPALEQEKAALEQILTDLNADRLPGKDAISAEHHKLLRGFQFLTLKPLLVILNSDEERFGKEGALLEQLSHDYQAIEFAGRFEMELNRLSEEEAAAFMEDLHIAASARQRLTLLAYNVLGYQTFFTVGPDEVRAWTIHKGDTAVEAAGVIHSDLARGFIRAECFSYDDLMAHGSEKALKEKGLIRLEGKTYSVKDGDILSIRFSV
ncbi:MAG: DUF933 domain-containing protein [Syntrophorhabdus sp.]